jgi:hypothetical protein
MSYVLRRPDPIVTHPAHTVAFGVVVAGTALAATVVSLAEPTGLRAADAFWSAALVAVVATFGATARSWTWFVPAGVGALVGDSRGTALAAVAILIAFVSVVRDSRSRALGALVAGLGVLALLRAEPVGFHGLSAVLTAAAVVPVLDSGGSHASRELQTRARRVALVFGAVICLMIAGAAVGALSVLDDLADGVRAIDGGMAAARGADDDLAAVRFDQAAHSLRDADRTLSSWFASPARALPVIGPNLRAVRSLAAQASDVAEVTSLAAYEADVDALRFEAGRLDPQTVAAMAEPLSRVNDALDRMAAEVEAARSPWLVTEVSSRIDRLDAQVRDAMPDARTAHTAVSIAPKLLGADGPKRYLVLFTTPVEARGRTGFPGNYAELVFDDGRLTMPVFGRIAELAPADPGAARTLQGPPELVARYGRFDVAATWQNLTMTVDFPSLVQAAAELYPQSGGQPIDGVLSVDPAGLASVMRYTGPIAAAGLPEPLTAENAERYLLFDQYVQFQDDNDERVDMLETVARTTFDRLTFADLPGPRDVTEHIDKAFDGGHIQFATVDPASATVLHEWGLTGALTPVEAGADSVTVTTANAAGNKIDLFLQRRERYDVTWDPATGAVTGTLRLTLENAAPASGLPTYVIGNPIGLPAGTNRSFVSIYSPFALEAARLGGQPVALQSEVEAGRNVYSAFVDIPAGGKVELELDLSGTIQGPRYRLDLPVQPFANPDEMAVSVEVAGDGEIASDEATVTGRVAAWTSTLDQPRSVSVTTARG